MKWLLILPLLFVAPLFVGFFFDRGMNEIEHKPGSPMEGGESHDR